MSWRTAQQSTAQFDGLSSSCDVPSVGDEGGGNFTFHCSYFLPVPVPELFSPISRLTCPIEHIQRGHLAWLPRVYSIPFDQSSLAT